VVKVKGQGRQPVFGFGFGFGLLPVPAQHSANPF